MKNKQQLATDYCQSWRGDYVAWAGAKSGFIAGWEAHQQLFQQPLCIALLELLQQKLEEEQIAYMQSKDSMEADMRIYNENALKAVIKLIWARQPTT